MSIEKVPFFLAPMAELSHRGLRELIEDFGGCDEYFTEMISAQGLLAGGPFEKWYIDAGPKPEKTVFQLLTNNVVSGQKAAAMLDKLDCAGIDINMGCSAPIIRKSGAGAAWMADIDKAGELVCGVRAVVKKRLSVKLRIGFKEAKAAEGGGEIISSRSPTEGRPDFEYLVRFCKRLESEGTELITLHPRLITEKFKRRARWDYVEALGKELNIPVAGNGDIASAEELAGRAEASFQLQSKWSAAIMVGRAAVRQPWIFAEARALSPEKQQSFRALSPNIEEIGLRFLELLVRYQPPEFYISRARRFFSFFCDNLKWGNYLKNQINKEESLQGIEKVWKEYFLTNK